MKSSRVNLYLPANLVSTLKLLAEEDEKSLNAYISKVLRRHIEDKTPTPESRRTLTPKPDDMAFKWG
jgi:hypothetical protein